MLHSFAPKSYKVIKLWIITEVGHIAGPGDDVHFADHLLASRLTANHPVLPFRLWVQTNVAN